MSLVQAEDIATRALREYLLRTLPAKVATINAARAPYIKAPRAGPYIIPAAPNNVLTIVSQGVDYPVTLTAGSRTAAQVKTQVDPVLNCSSVDAQLRLVLTSPTAVATGTPSAIGIKASDTGINEAFGWSAGGDEAVSEALVAPDGNNIRDGDQTIIDVSAGFGIVFSKKSSRHTDRNPHKNERDVVVETDVYVPVPQGCERSYSEFAYQAVAAIRSCIFDDRTLDGVVQYSDVAAASVMGTAFRFASPGAVSPLIAKVSMTLLCRVFER